MKAAHQNEQNILVKSLAVAAGVGIVTYVFLAGGGMLPLMSQVGMKFGDAEVNVDGLTPEMASTVGLIAFGMALAAE